MSDLSFKKFTRKLNERRYSGPQGTAEFKKLSPKMKIAILDMYSMITKASDPLITKIEGIITIEDWVKIKEHIQYSFLKDGYFAELKNAEILRDRLSLANEVSPYVGKYYSVEYVRKNILQQTDEDILEIDRQIAGEIKQGIIASQDYEIEDDGGSDINIGDE